LHAIDFVVIFLIGSFSLLREGMSLADVFRVTKEKETY
jgi:hypothetical protein